MGKRYKLRDIEQATGKPLEQVIPPLVNSMGSAKDAAKRLGVSDGTIITWLRENGYRRITQYVKQHSGETA